MRSYKLLTLCKSCHKAFMDNLVASYMNLDSRRGNSNVGLTGLEFLKLIKMLCLDFPEEVIEEILSLLGKSEDDIVPFEEFITAVNTVIMYEDYFLDAQDLFFHLDIDRTGTVVVQDFLKALEKLNRQGYAMPNSAQMQRALTFMRISDGMISLSNFIHAMFKVTRF